MATTTTARQTETGSKQSVDAQGKIQKLRDLFADAPELGKKALENVLRELTSDVSQGEWPRVESAGRTGARLGKVSELTIIVPLAPGGAKRLRAFLQLLGGYADAGKVGTVHNMRFVFLDNDTKFLFATAFDGDWDPYIDDFATDPRLYGRPLLCFRRLAGDSQPDGERLDPQAPDPRRRLVRRQSRSDGSGDATAEALRQGARRVPGQDQRLTIPEAHDVRSR